MGKTKCEKCVHCKLIIEYGTIICDSLNRLHTEVGSYAFMRPQYCPRFEKKSKKNKGGEEE